MAVPFLLFQIAVGGEAPPTPPSGDPGGRIVAHRAGDERGGRAFTRKQWAELRALLRAEREAAERVDELRKPKARQALAAASDAARDAIELLRQAEAAELVRPEVEKLTQALTAAAGAKSLAAVFRNANAATAHAQAIIAGMEAAARRAREQEEEEEEMAVVTAFLALH
jgi:hypothetical protein